ncbi:S8 family serine peptidase [Streptomyces fructofermentans]|uniref:S8 family serine peptidase n=1 Tax=Streptomyces fructofermentans TaxID=152141 RepID=UPI0033F58F96
MSTAYRRRPKLLALGAALAILTGVAPSSMAASSAPDPVNTPRSAGDRHDAHRTVTLITGDTVTVEKAADGTESRRVRGPHGEPVDFQLHQSGQDTYVYPDSARPYVSAGILDKSLFNVTQLLADGYDNAHTDQVPLLVAYKDSAAARTHGLPAGVSDVRAFSSFKGAALTQKHDGAATFWSRLTGGADASRAAAEGRAKPSFGHGIAKVWLDGKVEPTLSDTTAQIGAPEVWAAGNTGKGIDVAVLDSGVDAEHPDLKDRIAGSASFVPDEKVFEDHTGHGTHVASTIAGTGAASGGKEKGVAPGAALHIAKVIGLHCDLGGCSGVGRESWILAGMEWAAREQHAKIVNMSLGGRPTSGDDPLSQAVNNLSAETGTLFVIAAGNSGAARTIASPGAADAALTVGAVDGSDELADFSSQGPRFGDNGLKPELTAPGVGVLAARSRLSAGEGDYRAMSGTSMATPHVAGAAALLSAAHPDWTGRQLKDALVSSTKATPRYNPYQAGTGRLDAQAAVDGSVFATGSAYSGFFTWPHRPGETGDREVTYTNTGGTPVVLDLAIDAPSAPQGLFTLSSSRVTVPAHGTSKVVLTAHPDRTALDSHYSGMIKASAADGKVVARTLIGVGKEAERYSLSINAKDRAGKPLAGQLTVMGPDYYRDDFLDETGTLTLRLPVDTYAVWLNADVQGTHGPQSLGRAVLSSPEITLDRNRTVTLDASAAREVRALVPQRTTDAQIHTDLYRAFDDNHYTTGTLQSGSSYKYDSMWALPTGRKVTKGDFSFGARWRKEEPALTVASGKRDFDDLLVRRGATQLPDGRDTLDTVFAGNGAPADYTGVRAQGKIAVVRRNDTVSLDDQATAADQAGARLLMVVNDGPGRLEPWYTSPWSLTPPPPVTVATVTADEGEDLIGRIKHGRTPLTVVSSRVTDYLYDLAHHYDGAVPADLTHRPTKRDLARVDVSFRSHRQDRATEFRSALWHGAEVASPYLREVPAQSTRTDWVTADVPWMERAEIPGEVRQASPAVRYKAGTTNDLHWFGPIHRPRLNNQNGTQERTDDRILAEVPAWGDSGSNHVGASDTDNFDVRNEVTLYQGATPVAQYYADWIEAVELSPERLPYRLVSDNSRGSWTNPYSTRTHTEWSFTSGAGQPGTTTVLPLIQLDYTVDTDTAGKARRTAELAITPSHLPGGPDSKDIRGLTLDISYDDGATWHKADLGHRGRHWETRLRAPAASTYVTLRASAHDDRGNKVTQSITRAFGLK